MDIERMMAEDRAAAQALAEHVMMRKPDGSLSVRKTSAGVDIGEAYAKHGMRVWRRLQDNGEPVSTEAWAETTAWFREQAEFVVRLAMVSERAAARDKERAEASAQLEDLELRYRALQTEYEALSGELDHALRELANASDELENCGHSVCGVEHDTVSARSLHHRIEALETALRAQHAAREDRRSAGFISAAGSAAAGWLLAKALTTPTPDPLR